MACEINASPSNGLVQSADGSGIIKLKSDGKTTNALAWVNFNGTGTVAIRSSYNVSSITDNGTGDYTVNFATALSDANYAVSGMSTQNDGFPNAKVISAYYTGAYSTSSIRVTCVTVNSSSNVFDDPSFVNIVIHGN
jgi:hypothetical protein